MEPVVIGVDAGGTATRAVAVTLDGRRLGRSESGPANPHGRPPETVAATLITAVRQALHDVPPEWVHGATIGIAGHAAARAAPVHDVITQAWAGAGLPGRPRLVGDAVVAFAAGTAAPAGTVLIAGTGAVAAEIRHREVIRTADGLGWLLGDEGSGFWLGLAAAKATARALAAGKPPGALTRAIAQRLGTSDPDCFVTRCYQQPRQRLAEFARVVCRAATGGDPAARRIVRQAARRLAATAGQLTGIPGPLVLSGGLLTNPTPVRAELLRALGGTGGGSGTMGHPGPTMIAGDGAAGAAWLAAVDSGHGVDADALHRQLCDPAAAALSAR